MNRTLDETAAVLGLRPRAFRTRLRELRILTAAGDLASQHRENGYLFSDPRSRWNPKIRQYSHYAVVMVKEAGIDWLAKQLGITVTAHKKDTAA
jgi:hypothetical protein